MNIIKPIMKTINGHVEVLSPMKQERKTLTNYPPALSIRQKCQTIRNETIWAVKGHRGHDITRCVNNISNLYQQGADRLPIFQEQLQKSIKDELLILEKAIQAQLLDWNDNRQADIVDRLNFFCTLALLESNLSKKIEPYRLINEQALISTRIMHSVMRLDFRVHVKEVIKALGLLIGNVSKSPFTEEERLNFKPNILKMLSVVTDNTVRYWYILSLHRIVEEKNVTLEEMEAYKIYDVMVESIKQSEATQEVRYALRVITMFGEAHGVACIERFYEKGLFERVEYFLEKAPKMTFNFLEKLHGTEFKVAFPHALTELLLNKLVEYNPATELDHIKAVLRIGRYRLVALTTNDIEVRDVDFATPLDGGLVQKLCYIVRHSSLELKLRQYAYNFIRDLLILFSKTMQDLFSAVANRMIIQGLVEQAKDDLISETLKPVVLVIHKILIAGYATENFFRF